MGLTLADSAQNGWSYVSMVASIVTFLITAFYVYKYRSTKAGVIATSASISALGLLTYNAIIHSIINNPDMQVAAIFIPRDISHAFAFHTLFYASHRIICNSNRGGKLVVYTGYLWMVVAISASIAITVLFSKDSSNYSDDNYNLLLFTAYLIWGFVAVSTLLYLINQGHFNSKTKFTMLAFIGLTLITAIHSVVINYIPIENQGAEAAINFFLDELTMEAAIIIAAFYGATWIQTDSIKNYGDLEADEDLKTSH